MNKSPGRNRFADQIKKYLSCYKRERLGVFEDGFWGKQIRKSHILPAQLKKLNIVESYRKEFWTYWNSQKDKKLHKFFHHLNSSQAMCFNLFFPLIHEGMFELISNIHPFPVDSKPVTEFEKILIDKEGTNFDFYFGTGVKDLIFEIKYSESSFGKAKKDLRHKNKFEKLYKHTLKGKIKDKYLNVDYVLEHYQILRNVSFLNPNRKLVFIYPLRNEEISGELESVWSEVIEEDFRPRIELLSLEKFVESICENIPKENSRLRIHYELFKEKYLPIM